MTMHRLQSNHYLFIVRLALSLLGSVIAHAYRHAGHDYWLILTVVFGALAILPGYYRVRRDGEDPAWLIGQVLHWSGGLFAVIVVYAYHISGRIFHEEAGLIVLLMLALTTYLDGLRTGWRNCFIGVFLGLTAISIGYFDDYLWPLLMLASVAMIGSRISDTMASLSKKEEVFSDEEDKAEFFGEDVG
jgi:uncharacterized membrane protein